MIPKGEYGGGTMLIFDEGTYEIKKANDLQEALNNGEVKVFLRGKKLRGEWHLVETDKKKHQWLLFKSKDKFARSKHDFIAQPELSKTNKTKLPRKAAFMQPEKSRAPFDDKEYLFEVELAGLRAQLFFEDDQSRFMLQQKQKLPALPHLENAAAKIRAERYVLDGVLVCVDEQGRPSLQSLQQKLSSSEGLTEVSFYAFDVIYYEEWNTSTLLLRARKELLRSIIPQNGYIIYVDHVENEGTTLAQVVETGGLQGMLAKKAASQYRAGISTDWVQVKVKKATPKEDLNKSLKKVKPKQGQKSKVAFRNLNKVYWPRQGITKGELLHYYQQVAETLLPYLINRPVHMLRYPDGIDGEWFYQKQVMNYVPDWLETIQVSEKEHKQDVRYLLINDRDALLYCINLGSIDLHPWMSQAGSLEQPDIAFIDLDPKQAPFEHVVRLARSTGKLLRGIGLRPYVKTSGKTGIHICIPLVAGYSYEQARMFCEVVARIIAAEHSDIATVERSTSERGSKVYIDFLQNRREQTIVPPYVVRPVEGATVSAPLEWDELEKAISPAHFDLKNMPERLQQKGDLFRGTLDDKQELTTAIEKIQEYYQQL